MPKRSAIRLTKREVDKALPDTFLWDAELKGFGLRVTSAGTKSFLIQYRTRSGRSRRMTLGGYPALTPDQARDLARAELGSVAQGHDPAELRSLVRQVPTVRDMCAYYWGDYARSNGLKQKTVNDAKHLLQRFVLPEIGALKVSEVRGADIRKLHADARDAVRRYQANRLLAVLSRVFSLSVEEEYRTTNPCKGVKKFPEDQRTRHLSEAEVARLLDACDRAEDRAAADAVRLLLFTGARLQEVLKAPWSQFDLDRGVWEKPSSHTKTKRQHRVELGAPALAVLRRMRTQSPWGRFLFPGRQRPDSAEERPRSDLKRPWARITADAGLDDVSLHDLRRTTASFMLDENVPLTVIGAALGHSQIATTQRYARLRQSAQQEGVNRATERMLGAQVMRKAG